jgi:ssDNA-binding Zn-finger/Zn-ribbon topoisomerase 1
MLGSRVFVVAYFLLGMGTIAAEKVGWTQIKPYAYPHAQSANEKGLLGHTLEKRGMKMLTKKVIVKCEKCGALSSLLRLDDARYDKVTDRYSVACPKCRKGSARQIK